jgi:large subunit ribosomal protein L10
MKDKKAGKGGWRKTLKKEEKHEFVAWMKGQLESAPSVVLADYRGLDVAQMNSLRIRCREAGVQFKVVKNTLMLLASENTDMSGIKEHLGGPTALAWHSEDPGAPARVLVGFAREKGNEDLEIKCGAVRGRLLTADDVKGVLAVLPTREELLAKFAGSLSAGPSKLMRALSAGPQMLGRGLAALRRQREAAQG